MLRKNTKNLAAVSCSAMSYRLGGVKMVLGLMGKPRRAWVVHGVGAWHGDGAWVWG